MVLTTEEAFARFDNEPDEAFYSQPRFVTHIDDEAIARVTELYREFFPANGRILDLMSSWVSHLPEEVSYERVVGIGLNERNLPATRASTITLCKILTRIRNWRSRTRSLTQPLSASLFNISPAPSKSCATWEDV